MIPNTHQITYTPVHTIDAMMPLGYTHPSVRAYRADELDDAPQSAIDRACATLAEWFEPKHATEWAVESFNVQHRDGHGIELESGKSAGPFWSVGSQGEGASLTIGVHDFAAYLRWRDCDRHVARRLLWLHDQGEVCLSFEAKEGRYCGTRALLNDDFDSGLPGEADRTAAIEWLEADANDAASELEHEFLADVRADYEHAGSREQLESVLRDMDRAITAGGEFVDLSDCQTSTGDR